MDAQNLMWQLNELHRRRVIIEEQRNRLGAEIKSLQTQAESILSDLKEFGFVADSGTTDYLRVGYQFRIDQESLSDLVGAGQPVVTEYKSGGES